MAQYHDNYRMDNDTKKFYYYPRYGYVGEDTLVFKVYDKNDYSKFILKRYFIDIKRPIFEENRDFMITHVCEDVSNHYNPRGNSKSIDISIVNDNLELVEKVIDDKELFRGGTSPYDSNIEINYLENNYPFTALSSNPNESINQGV